MAVYRASLSFAMDGTLPKDHLTINPHYSGSDPEALAQALALNLTAYNATATLPYTIKIYDATKAPPSYPLATRTQVGTPTASAIPREVAICLSYYAGVNRPRFRGRLYLPGTWFTAAPNVRPSGAIITAALGFANVLKNGLPAQHNWVLFSKVENKSQGTVTDVWVDDEWDTVRSRGLSPTTRQTAKA